MSYKMNRLLTIITKLDKLRMTTKAEKDWLYDITDYINNNGLGELYGHEYEGRIDIQRHHVLGKTAKQNKTLIGPWFIIPVPFELHDPNMKNEHHVGHCKKAFVKRFGAQRDIFSVMYHSMKESGFNVPNEHIYNTIMSTSA